MSGGARDDETGGKATVDNIELRCGPHNRHEAELFYAPGTHRGGVDVVSERTAVYGRWNSVTRPGTGDFTPCASGGR